MKKETGEINVCATGANVGEGCRGYGWLEMRVLLRMDGGRVAEYWHWHAICTDPPHTHTWQVPYYYMYGKEKNMDKRRPKCTDERTDERTNGQAGGRRSISCIVTNAKTFFCRSGQRGRFCQVMASLAIGHQEDSTENNFERMGSSDVIYIRMC